jgi:hypothetical protein
VRGGGQVFVSRIPVKAIAAIKLHEKEFHDPQIRDKRDAELHQDDLAHSVYVGAAAVDVVICGQERTRDQLSAGKNRGQGAAYTS